jgi:arabinan endo-1,5-alpha-L-arabinosidase
MAIVPCDDARSEEHSMTQKPIRSRKFWVKGAFVTTALSCAMIAAAAFWNLTGSLVTHDPCITKESSTWWVLETGTGIGVKYSSNGLAWTQGVQIFANPLSWWKTYAPNMATNDVWAPDVHQYNGKSWCYYAVSSFGSKNSAIGLVSATNIQTGNWTDNGMVISSGSSTSYNAIDPNLCFDSSGRPWLAFGSWFDGIHIVALNTSTMKPTGTIYSIAQDTAGIEGASVVYNGGYYYLFVSKGTCCNGSSSTYHICYGRSTSITGPYKDKNGTSMSSAGGTVLDAGNSRWLAPGGQSIFNNGGNWVLARHALDQSNNLTPTLLINDLYWTGGWPTY